MFFLKLTADWVLVFDWITGSGQVITLGEKEGVHAKAKFQPKLTPGVLVTFLPTYSLHNHLLESP